MFVKNKILRIKNITKLNIVYIAGKNIVSNNSNLGLTEAHKIIISNNYNGIILLCYDNDSTLYNEDLLDTITINELTDIIEYLLKEN